MERKKWILIFWLLHSSYLFAQEISPEKLGFTEVVLKDKNLGDIHYYITKCGEKENKPVLLYLDGSGAYPLFQYTERGLGSSVPFDFKKISEEYHLVIISKPGVPFCDSVKMSDYGYPEYPVPEEYKKRLSLEWRSKSASKVIADVKRKNKIKNNKIAVLGISEGFQVAAHLASTNKSVTHLLIFVGNGLTQFFDFLLQNRIDAQLSKITLEESQQEVDSLYTIIRDIYQNPNATDKEWYGHTYLRWSSFCNFNPTEAILSLNIPVYIVAAANDRNTSVLGTDYLYLESIRKNKNNISYHVYPYDHSLNEYVLDKEGQITGVKPHLQEILQQSLDWLKLN